MFSSLFLPFLACTQTTWSTAEDCYALSKGEARDDCFSHHVITLLQNNAQKTEQDVATLIHDPLVRDYIWLKVTREYNPVSQKYCQKIQDKTLKERCVTLVRRPHLYKEQLEKTIRPQKHQDQKSPHQKHQQQKRDSQKILPK